MSDQILNPKETPRADAKPSPVSTNEHQSTVPEHLTDASEENPSSRRKALRTLGTLGLGAGALSATAFLGAHPREAVAKPAFNAASVNVAGASLAHGPILQYALTLEYLEMFFYEEGTGSLDDMDNMGGIVPEEAQAVFELIRDHERTHVEVLRQVITDSTDMDPVTFTRDDFDYTAGGNFNPFENYDVFLTLAQGFEDTGVRAYKGQAPALLGTPYLDAALQIHALEARHAAEVRRLRDERNMGDGPEPWIVLLSGTEEGDPLANVYRSGDTFENEDNVMQAGLNLTTDLASDYSAEAVSASFDEPLSMDYVRNVIAAPFIRDMDGGAATVMLDFSTDVGIANYAYALEQLEAAFYAMVATSIDDGSLSFSSDSATEYFRDLAAHEANHRDLLAAALGENAIIDLTPDFSSVDFGDPDSVLTTAQVLEDTGVSAYNGAAKYFSNSELGNTFLGVAGKIVSVEARHASAIRAEIEPESENFADLTELTDFGADPDKAYDAAQSPEDVLAAAGGFIVNDFDVTPPSGGF